MIRSAKELWLAFAAIIVITIFYLIVAITMGGVPAASGFFGHSLGVLGFVLMLMTETLYSRRKRSRRARWGKMSAWLQFHIFTGLVGPYLVFLHTSFKFNGLAGVVLLLTAVIVLSGFFGRYIYTAIPRTADGVEIEAGELQHEIGQLEEAISGWMARQPVSERFLRPVLAGSQEAAGTGYSLVLGRSLQEWQARIRWMRVKKQLGGLQEVQIERLERLLAQRRQLNRQVVSLSFARRLLGLWHSVHVPIGVALFTTATVHIVAAIYYASLLR
jgi:hypothetical protein